MCFKKKSYRKLPTSQRLATFGGKNIQKGVIFSCLKLFFGPLSIFKKICPTFAPEIKNGLVAQWIEQLPSKQ